MNLAGLARDESHDFLKFWLQSRKSKLLIATVMSMLILSTSVTPAHAFTNGQSASLAIGQKDFTSSNPGLSQSGLSGPGWVIIDSSGNMWVAEFFNSRVLEFKPPFSTGMQASLVIGKPNFESSTKVTSQSGLSGQGGLAFDSSGNLWVADHDNNRVLEFKPSFSSGMPASLVIGQKDFTTARMETTKDGLARPFGVAFDHSDNLWVNDGGNYRVLEFIPPFSNGMSGSLVIGQANFETNRISISQSGLSANYGDIAVDPSGNVWVGDNNRVLEFRAPFSNGMDASVVIGQANFATAKPSLGRTGLSGQQLITTDSAGNLWVSDGKTRVLEFQSPFSNGMGASLVIGQQDFDSSLPATTQSGFQDPDHPGFDSSGNLWVPDFDNNRVLEFSSTAVPEFPTASLAIVALVSLAVVAVVSRRFSVRLPAR